VSRQADALKSKHPLGSDVARPEKTSPVSAPPRPVLSAEELHAEAERARDVLSDRLRKLSRKRR
jgi:hypothetical protein